MIPKSGDHLSPGPSLWTARRNKRYGVLCTPPNSAQKATCASKGATGFDRSSIEQVWDYGLDLKNFHAASHQAPIVPVLVATEAVSQLRLDLERDDDNLYRPARVNAETLAVFIAKARQSILGSVIEDAACALGASLNGQQAGSVQAFDGSQGIGL